MCSLDIDLVNIAQETCKVVDEARRADGLFGATAMPEVSVLFPLRCTTAGTVHPANAIACYRR